MIILKNAAGWLAGRLLRSCSSDLSPNEAEPIHPNDPYLIEMIDPDQHLYVSRMLTPRPMILFPPRRQASFISPTPIMVARRAFEHSSSKL